MTTETKTVGLILNTSGCQHSIEFSKQSPAVTLSKAGLGIWSPVKGIVPRARHADIA